MLLDQCEISVCFSDPTVQTGRTARKSPQGSLETGPAVVLWTVDYSSVSVEDNEEVIEMGAQRRCRMEIG